MILLIFLICWLASAASDSSLFPSLHSYPVISKRNSISIISINLQQGSFGPWHWLPAVAVDESVACSIQLYGIIAYHKLPQISSAGFGRLEGFSISSQTTPFGPISCNYIPAWKSTAGKYGQDGQTVRYHPLFNTHRSSTVVTNCYSSLCCRTIV